jgi:hypothetical protein
LYLALLYDLGYDFERVGRFEDLFERLLGGAVAARSVLEDIFGGYDVGQVAFELAPLDFECCVRIDEYFETLSVRL